MSLLFIRIRLLIYLGLFGANLAAIYIRQIRPLLWSLAVLSSVLLGAAHTYFYTINSVQDERIMAVSLPDKVPHKTVSFTKKTLEDELRWNQELLTVQPQHTGVLLNISLLQKSLQNQKESFITWEEARKLDPNNPIFSSQNSSEEDMQ